MALNDTDNLIVQRASALGTIQIQNMATIQDDDLLIVGRGSTSYKITGADFKDSVTPEPEPNPLELAVGVTPVQPVASSLLTASATAFGGVTPYTFTYQWYKKLDPGDWTLCPETTQTLQLSEADVGYQYKCDVTVTDSASTSTTTTSNETQPVLTETVAPVIASVGLVESDPDDEFRFTNQSFVSSVSMQEEGAPVSTKTFDAYVEGTVDGSPSTKKYLEFDSSGNVTDLLDNPQDPPYTTTDTNPTLTLTFPATFPSGNTPDDELGDGTTLTVSVTAENVVSTVGPETATVQPEAQASQPVLEGFITLYDGTDSSKTIVNGMDFTQNTGLVWFKGRTQPFDYALFDTIRGTEQRISSNTATKNNTETGTLLSFNSDGFTIGTSAYVNSPVSNYVAWAFEAGPQYFDIVQYTGTAGGQAIDHNLGAVPGMIIVKNLSTGDNWAVYHVGTGNTQALMLNGDSSAETNSVFWDNNTPTSSQFFVGANSDRTNKTGDLYIAYLFAQTSTFCKCSTYIGNDQSQTVGTGFKPQWVLIKSTATGDWIVYDNKRLSDPPNTTNLILDLNLNNVEESGPNFTFTDDGFTVGGTGSINSSGTNFCYLAIAAPAEPTSLTQEQFNQQALKFGTYENRKQVVCGEQATANRDALIQYFADQGYSLDDILNYL